MSNLYRNFENVSQGQKQLRQKNTFYNQPREGVGTRGIQKFK